MSVEPSYAGDLAAHYSHDRFMRLALAEARLALESGDIPVGAVIVHNGVVVSSGRNGIESMQNDVLHAEFSAVQKIPHFLATHRRQCTVYTTLEPCAMCLGAIIYSSVDRIVWGAGDPLCATHATVACTPYYSRKTLVLMGGVLQPECQELLDVSRRAPSRPEYDNVKS